MMAAIAGVLLLFIVWFSPVLAQTTVTNCTDCATFASCTANGTSLICACDSEFIGNGTDCAYQATTECSKNVITDGYAMRVKLNQTYIDSLGINPSDLGLYNASCNATVQGGYYVLETSEFDDCGSVMASGNSSNIYSNEVSNSGGMPSGKIIRIPVSCDVGTSLAISLTDTSSPHTINVTTLGQGSIELPTVTGTGTVSASMYLYVDGNYASPYNGVPVLRTTDTLYVKIALDTPLIGVYMTTVRCWGSTDAAGTANIYDIIESPGCMKSDVAGGLITSNGVSEEAKFQLQVFLYVQTDVVYLHCAVELCKPDGTNTCTPTCSRRRKRDTGVEPERVLRSTLIIRAVDDDVVEVPPETSTNVFNAPENLFHTIIVIIVVGVLLLLLCIALIVYLCATRRKKS